MSFFNDVLGSIGSDRAPAPPPKQIKRPSSTDSTDLSKPVAKLGINGTSIPQTGTKGKAEEASGKPSERPMKPNLAPGLTSTVRMGQPLATKAGPKQPLPSKSLASALPSSSSPAVPKVPPKGSFADLIARAKTAQEQKGQNQVGMIKHQAVPREKMSKAVERRREEEEKAKSLKRKLGPKPGSNGRIEKRRSASPVKKRDRGSAPKQPRAPTQKPVSSYKGTMKMASDRNKVTSSASGNGSGRDRARTKRPRYDEYLGTDEEEDSDIEENEQEDGYGSDASSDMEAGAFDIDEEENRALKAAKTDDAKELELEKRLKREKEERKRRLQAMADKRK